MAAGCPECGYVPGRGDDPGWCTWCEAPIGPRFARGCLGGSVLAVVLWVGVLGWLVLGLFPG